VHAAGEFFEPPALHSTRAFSSPNSIHCWFSEDGFSEGAHESTISSDGDMEQESAPINQRLQIVEVGHASWSVVLQRCQHLLSQFSMQSKVTDVATLQRSIFWRLLHCI